MRILLESYGCALNKGEAGELAICTSDMGHEIINPLSRPGKEMPDTDMAIIFTCGVIQITELKMLKRIGQLSKEGIPIMVCGCLGAMAESEILKASPDAMIFPPASNDHIIRTIAGMSEISPSPHHPPSIPGSEADRIGILPIATGCLGDCAYCITRFARGQLRSRSLKEIEERAMTLVSSGIVELQVTSQDSAVYGMDMGMDMNIKGNAPGADITSLAGPSPRLPDVLDAITSIEGNYMVRVGMMNPEATLKILEPLISSMGNERMFRFIHIPVQSGNDEILASMKRRYTANDFEKIIDSLRRAHSDISISTDIITGFPGETDAQFRDSLDLMDRIKPDIINITRFSPRKGTVAANMRYQVPGWVSKERSRQMTDLRFKMSRHRFSTMIGRNISALATEYRKPGTTILRTVNYRPIVVEEVLPLGRWCEVEISAHTDIHMIGKVC